MADLKPCLARDVRPYLTYPTVLLAFLSALVLTPVLLAQDADATDEPPPPATANTESGASEPEDSGE